MPVKKKGIQFEKEKERARKGGAKEKAKEKLLRFFCR